MVEHELPPMRGILSLTNRLSALAPVAGAAITFGTLGAVHITAAVLIGVLATFIAFAGLLIASDWKADVQSRQAWAQLGLTPAHLSRAVELARESDLDRRYLAPSSDEALRQALQVYRAAAQKTYSVPDIERSAGLPPAQPMPARARDAGAESKAVAPKRAPSDVVGTRLAATKTASWKGRSRDKLLAARVRLVANGGTWPDRPAPIPPRVNKTADIIVLSDRQREQAPPLPEASIVSSGAESTAQPTCRGPPRPRARRSAIPPEPVVCDNFGPRLPIGRAELDVLETYLERELRELLGRAKQADDSEKA